MGLLRKSTLLVMTLLIVWITTPSFACALPAGQMNRPSCCHDMAPDCTQMNGSCCQFGHQNSAVEEILPFSPEHAHQLFLALHSTDQELVLDDAMNSFGAMERPIPTASPGRNTILRI